MTQTGVRVRCARTAFVAVVAASAFLLSQAGVSAAAPADIDRTFGDRGFVGLGKTTGFLGAPSLPYFEGIEMGPGGGILVLSRSPAGCSGDGCASSFRLIRHRPDGSLDSTFGEGGGSPAVMMVSRTSWYSNSFAVGPSGEAVIAAPSSDDAIELVKLTPAGSADSAFGTQGRVSLDGGGPGVLPRVAVQQDGKIVVVAKRLDRPRLDTSGPIVAWRLTPAGGLDPTFGTGGVTEFPSSPSLPDDLALLDDEGFAVGTCCVDGENLDPSQRNRVYVGRVDARGAHDPAFGGWRAVPVPIGATTLDLLALPGGRLLLAGRGRSGPFLAGLRADGSLDSRFGDGGVLLARSGISLSGARVDDRGRMVLVGTGGTVADRLQVRAIRRLSDGNPDRTFAGGGPAKADLGGATYARGLLLGPDGRIVVLAERSFDCVRTCAQREAGMVAFVGGTSRVRCRGRRATIVGTREADRLIGTKRGDVIAALGGADVVRGGGGPDLICGGRGNDRLFGGAGNDRLFGGHGNDRLFGRRGHDRLFGGPGNDRLFGGAGSDRLFGQRGRDLLVGGRGNDLLVGGRGQDRLIGGPGRNRLRP